MDVTDPASVRAAAAEVSERLGHLDVLVNNAGILPEATNADVKEVLDLAMFEQTYATNVLGPVAVVEAFLPLIRKSPAGRIVNVSSTVGSLAHQTDPNSPWYSMVVLKPTSPPRLPSTRSRSCCPRRSPTPPSR